MVHAPVNRVASALDRVAQYSANDSFSHRSPHQRMVTRSPNHWCDISCRITMARSSYMASVTFERNRNCSEMVTQPMFSIAPTWSATKTWSYLAYG